MKCPHCGDVVRCASCDARVNSSQHNWQKRRRRNGLCARCPNRLSFRDSQRGRWNCRACRLKEAARNRARYTKVGRKDRGGKAAA